MDTNYTTKSQEAISGAMQAAAAAGNPQIEPAHLLGRLRPPVGLDEADQDVLAVFRGMSGEIAGPFVTMPRFGQRDFCGGTE